MRYAPAARSATRSSASLALRAALLAERLDAFLIVLAVAAVGDQRVEQAEVALAGRPQELVHRLLGRAQGERRVLCDLQRGVTREFLQLGLGYDLVEQRHAERTLGAGVRPRR